MSCFLLAFLVGRRKKDRKEDPDLSEMGQLNPMFSTMVPEAHATTSAALLAPFLAGDEPIYALGCAKNEQYDAFRRTVAFDHMYYGNPPLVLDDAALDDVYDVLRHAKCPPAPDLIPLRDLCRRFLDLEIETKVPSENAIEDLAMFFDSAIADDLVERAIDALAKHPDGHALLPGDAIYDMGGTAPAATSLDEVLANLFGSFDEDYCASNNQFLVPVTGNSLLRQLPKGFADADAIYDMGSGRTDGGGKAAPGIAYSMAVRQRHCWPNSRVFSATSPARMHD